MMRRVLCVPAERWVLFYFMAGSFMPARIKFYIVSSVYKGRTAPGAPGFINRSSLREYPAPSHFSAVIRPPIEAAVAGGDKSCSGSPYAVVFGGVKRYRIDTDPLRPGLISCVSYPHAYNRISVFCYRPARWNACRAFLCRNMGNFAELVAFYFFRSNQAVPYPLPLSPLV